MSSIIAINGEVNVFDSSKFSNLLEKSSVIQSECDKNEELSTSAAKELKEDFCSRLLRLTQQKQNLNKREVENIPATVESPIEEEPLLCSEVIKPIFNVIRPKRQLYKLSKFTKASIESTQGSDLSRSEYQISKAPLQASVQEKAVMLIP
jgi:hypothetical protein